MQLPVAPGEKYGLIALDAATDLDEPLDLGAGFFAIPRGAVQLPDYWKEWIGSIQADAIEHAGLVLLAKRTSEHPGVIDEDNIFVGRRVDNLLWGVLAVDNLRTEGEGMKLTGANIDGKIDVRQQARTLLVIHPRGLITKRISQEHLKDAAVLAFNLGKFLALPGMRRLKLAVRTFMSTFSESDLGQRIHQFVRVVSDGITHSWGNDEFKTKSTLLVKESDAETCRELYVMRSNAEHFNLPDAGLHPVPTRGSLVRGYRRAHEAEALARHCIARLIRRSQLWPEFDDDRIDAFWSKPFEERKVLWGEQLDLSAAMADFDPASVPDEG